jgi:antitoxin component YwqK of YwqJK toxin-antitoxin module
MKINLIILFQLLSSFLLSQEDSKVYFFRNWMICPIEIASYFRISGFNSKIPSYEGRVTDYYYPSGIIEMTGEYVNGKKNGDFIFFYPNGKTRLIANYNNDSRNMTWKEYYPNGILRIEVIYQNGKEQLIQMNDSLGKPLFNGKKLTLTTHYLNPRYSIYDTLETAIPDQITLRGKYVERERNGKWTVIKNGKIYANPKYKNGKLINGLSLLTEYKVNMEDSFVYPLINDPVKLYVTETFAKVPNSIIRNNYVLEGLNENNLANREKVIISNRNDLIEYLKSNFTLSSNKPDSHIIIILNIKNGTIVNFTTKPKIGESSQKNLKLIFDTIEKLDFQKSDTIQIQYKLEPTNIYK